MTPLPPSPAYFTPARVGKLLRQSLHYWGRYHPPGGNGIRCRCCAKVIRHPGGDDLDLDDAHLLADPALCEVVTEHLCHACPCADIAPMLLEEIKPW